MLCVLLGRSATRETKSICPRVKAEKTQKTLCIWLWAGRRSHFEGVEIGNFIDSDFRYYQDQNRCQNFGEMFVDTDSSDESNIYSITGQVWDEVHWTELTTACWACLWASAILMKSTQHPVIVGQLPSHSKFTYCIKLLSRVTRDVLESTKVLTHRRRAPVLLKLTPHSADKKSKVYFDISLMFDIIKNEKGSHIHRKSMSANAQQEYETSSETLGQFASRSRRRLRVPLSHFTFQLPNHHFQLEVQKRRKRREFPANFLPPFHSTAAGDGRYSFCIFFRSLFDSSSSVWRLGSMLHKIIGCHCEWERKMFLFKQTRNDWTLLDDWSNLSFE